jgi:peptidyl-prolyl cis-trans isomerase C
LRQIKLPTACKATLATTQRLKNHAIPVGFASYLKGVTPMAKATARHILVASEAKCNELKAAIEGGADFAQVAKDNSTCPSSRDGGSLGSFGPGQMVKEFDTVVFSAPINVVQGPVKTQFGFHLLEVTSRQD